MKRKFLIFVVLLIIICILFFPLIKINTYLNTFVFPNTNKELVDEKYENVWIVHADKDKNKMAVFIEDKIYNLKMGRIMENIDNTMADIVVKNGKIKEIYIKEEKITGKILSKGDNYIEIEGYGIIKLDSKCKFYKAIDDVTVESLESLIVGYDIQEFFVANGEICGAVILNELKPEKIRVLIKTSGFNSIFHDKVEITSDSDFYIVKENENKHFKAGEIYTIERENMSETDRIKLIASANNIKLLSVDRAGRKPVYKGTIELSCKEEGITIVNEVDIEEYLKSVVPSEMPVSFGVEALKVQAVCARSYAYKQLSNDNYAVYGAHVDDSISYQVYNNIDESEISNQAILDTKNEKLIYKDELVQTFYFSTSCGYLSDVSLWGNDSSNYPYYVSKCVGNVKKDIDLTDNVNFEKFIKQRDENDFDYGFDFYRWSVKADLKQMSQNVNSKIGKNNRIGNIKNIIITKRANGGACTEILIQGEEGEYTVSGEAKIRDVFGSEQYKLITFNDESRNMASLPSAFFVIDVDDNNVNIYGGGFGHGIGMSQNAVLAMVNQNMNYREILNFFYPNTQLVR